MQKGAENGALSYFIYRRLLGDACELTLVTSGCVPMDEAFTRSAVE